MKLTALALPLSLALAVTVPNRGTAADDSAPLDIARQLNKAFVQVAKKVSPSVVVIRVTQEVPAVQRRRQSQFFDWFREQFPNQIPEGRQEELEELQKRQISGQGSGVVIRKDGYIATNSHVVDGAEKVKVIFQDGTEYDGKIQGVDPQSDLAVIKIEATNLVASKFADSDKAQVGEFAIAIGAPYELDYSVTIGHISAKGRSIYASEELVDSDFIQTDASINPGNSGGPLVNLDGEIVGINTMIRGIGTGIGFAIPSNLAHEITDALIADGKVTRAWLGISIRSLREDATLRKTYPDIKDGVVVMDILSDGPAASSKLAAGDIILAVDGRRVTTVQGLKNEIRPKKVGASMSLTVNRAGKEMRIKVEPGKRPDQGDLVARRAPASARPETALGITVEAITPSTKRKFNLDTDEGVLVTDVKEGGVAARFGIAPGDIITHINRVELKNVNDLREALRDADLQDGVVMKIISDGSRKLRVLRTE
jgi:serine protease Do